jgi:hypothetical protein
LYCAKKKTPNSDEYDWETLELHMVRPLDDPETDRSPCSELIFDIQTRQAICLLEIEKKEVCRRYPLGPQDRIFDGCGFKFEEVSQ